LAIAKKLTYGTFHGLGMMTALMLHQCTVADYEGMRVSELMQPNERKWNKNLIHQLFNLRDGTKNLKIPISCMRDEHVPIWRFSKNGVYSVR
jgi:hypothetical protein